MVSTGTLLFFSLCNDVASMSPCPVGFLDGSPVSIDGKIGSIDGKKEDEWEDASIITPEAPCFRHLLEGSGVANNVNIYTKRYQSNGVPYLGFYFEITDMSHGNLEEMIVIQIDGKPDDSTALDANDFRFVFTNPWAFKDDDKEASEEAFKEDDNENYLIDLEFASHRGIGSASPDPVCPNDTWGNLDKNILKKNRDYAARKTEIGYDLEVQIARSLFPEGDHDIGIAFAVINDTEDCISGVCNDHGTSYPQELPVNNIDNPVYGCHESWTDPSRWATGYFNNSPEDVYISRQEAWWLSEDVDALDCYGKVDNNYYPSNPCKIKIRAHANNATSRNQVRHIAYFVGEEAIGGRKWRFVDLKKVEVSGGGTVKSPTRMHFDSEPAEGVKGPTGHPCVRAYILPEKLDDRFDEQKIKEIGENSDLKEMPDLKEMIAVYRLGDQHWAQQNLSRQGADANCPEGCAIENLPPPPMAAAPKARAKALNAPFDEQTRIPGKTPKLTEPKVKDPGSDLSLPEEDFEKYKDDHVIVQVTAFSSKEPKPPVTSKPRYNFIEEKGGVVKVFPADLLVERRFLNFEFLLENPDTIDETVFLQMDVHVPNELRGVQFGMNLSSRGLTAGASTKVKGQIIMKPSGWSLSLHGGANDPQSPGSTVITRGLSAGLGLEYLLNEQFALELFLGYDRFDGASSFPAIDARHLSLYAKAYRDLNALTRGFLVAGVGVSDFSPGSTESGYSAGFGVQYNLRPRLALESTAKYHSVSGGDLEFVNLQASLRIRF